MCIEFKKGIDVYGSVQSSNDCAFFANALLLNHPVWRSWLSLLGRNSLYTVRNEPGGPNCCIYPDSVAREVTQFYLVKRNECEINNTNEQQTFQKNKDILKYKREHK